MSLPEIVQKNPAPLAGMLSRLTTSYLDFSPPQRFISSSLPSLPPTSIPKSLEQSLDPNTPR